MAAQIPDHIVKQLEDLRQKEAYLEVINSFAEVLFNAKSIDEIVWSVAKHAIAKLGYYDCVIYLYDEQRNKLIQRAAHGPKNTSKRKIFEPIEITPGEGIVGAVFLSGKGEIVNDTSSDPRYIIDDEARLSEITIPLSYEGKMLGVLDSEHPEKDFFKEQDFKMLTTVAAMVSTNIEKARITEELRRYQKDLEGIITEKTHELKKTNELLKKQNREKELLLKEIHHRVKNNMQIMISLLNLQMGASQNDHERMILKDFQDRIRSMAIIHERLYLEKDMSTISINQYVEELAQSILSSFYRSEKVKVHCNIEPISMDLDASIPLGLIINELMTNSLKHAFEEKKQALIRISLNINETKATFEYSDNGIGYDLDDRSPNSFGLDLIDILAGQIGTSVEHEIKNGYTCRIVLKSETLH